MNMRADERADCGRPDKGQRRRALLESLSIVSIMLVAVAAGVGGVWAGSKAAITANFRHDLMAFAQTAASLIDPSLHQQIRRPEQLNDDQYIKAVTPLRRMRKAVPDIHYLYTLVRDGQEVRFVLDAADPGLKTASGTPDQSGVWEAYAHASPALELALGRPGVPGRVAADTEPTSDEWGAFMTGLAPLLDADGHQIGAVGIDVDAAQYLGRLRQARNRLLLGLLPAATLSVVFGFVFYHVRLRGLIAAHIAYTNEQTARLAAEALATAAQRDKLTQLATRTVFIEALEAASNRMRMNRQHSVTVLFLDFDRFKLINDSLGHDAGDELLRSIAARLRNVLKLLDAASVGAEPGTICRFGGDEFLVLLNDLQNAEGASAVASRLLSNLAQPYSIFGTEVHSTVSIGIVTSNTGTVSATDLIRNADVAMYEAKRAGRGCSVVFNDSMHARRERQMIIETSLRRALGAGELYLEYQPIVDLATGSACTSRHCCDGNIRPW